MQNDINKYLKDNNYSPIIIPNDIIQMVYDLFCHDIVGSGDLDPWLVQETVGSGLEYYYGIYYSINKDYDKMKKYYLIAIEQNNALAMNNLALYYEYKERDPNEMKKYFLMAINHNCVTAMYNLGYYYNSPK